MDGFFKAVFNYRTTLIGAALAVLAVWQGLDGIPDTGDEVFTVGVASLIALFGALAKDGATGSEPMD